MKITRFDYNEVPYISPADLAYIKQDQALRPFYKYIPELSAFADVIRDKSNEETDRKLLQSVLRSQYENCKTATDTVHSLIGQLSSTNTFTVVTAHQPVLFTGPLYVIYKIVSVLKLARTLNQTYPEFNFLPVFVTGGEDHDFEEMNHLRLYGKEITWQNDESGPVGRMSTKTLKSALDSLRDVLGEAPTAREIFEMIDLCHSHERYGQAFVDLINGLFGKYGLIVLNMDHPDLKKKMIPIFKKELFEQEGARRVRQTQDAIVKAGFSEQAYVRDINLFYLLDKLRARIEREGSRFVVIGTEISFSEEEMIYELQTHPERFSPNVITRPLYQETILPNLAYIGGGGEIAYWLERKSQFEHYGLNFPMLIRRDSCLWVESSVIKRMLKTGTEVTDYFLPKDEHEKNYLAKKSETEFKLGKEKGQLIQLFKAIEEKAKEIDPTLRSTVAAESKNALKILTNIEDKLRKAEKKKHDVEIGQINTIREKLFPMRGLQERKDNFLNFYLRNAENYFDILLEAFEPLNQEFIVIAAEQ